jgi:hypothetical protein
MFRVRVAGNDAPPIGERAAARRRCTTEGGDEHAGVTRRVITPSSCLGNVRGERRDQGRTAHR